MKSFISYFIISFSIIYPLYSFSDSIILQSTSSSRDSGLLNFLIPKFTESSDIKVKVVASGTGQALRNARDCNGDLLLVHSLQDELKFISDGFGLKRYELMTNDYVLVGPSSNPANLSMSDSPKETFTKIFMSNVKFISRSDDSGTNKKELSLWQQYSFNYNEFSPSWYIRSGQGMGSTLNIAIGLNGYTFSDRSTWIKFQNKSNHKILYESPNDLLNTYSIVTINYEKCPNIKFQKAMKFVNWLLSTEGKSLINSYKIDGQQVFFAK